MYEPTAVFNASNRDVIGSSMPGRLIGDVLDTLSTLNPREVTVYDARNLDILGHTAFGGLHDFFIVANQAEGVTASGGYVYDAAVISPVINGLDVDSVQVTYLAE